LSSITERAWAAGFYDGEGSSSRNKGSFVLSISQKDYRPLARFAAAFDVEIAIYDNRLFDIRLTGEKAFHVLHAMWPYLSEPKKEQARRVLWATHEVRSRRFPKINWVYDYALVWTH
jgi:hypothetical protein